MMQFDIVAQFMQSGVNAVFPAAVLSVKQGGETIFHRAYGYLDPETRRLPAQLNTLFDLASLTKLFTATAFMTLVDAEKVTLQTPVADVLPQFAGRRPISATEDPLTKTPVPPDPEFAGQTVNAADVTFQHLLTHTSGLAAWRSLYKTLADKAPVPLPTEVTPEKRRARIAPIYGDYGFAYPPGAKMICRSHRPHRNVRLAKTPLPGRSSRRKCRQPERRRRERRTFWTRRNCSGAGRTILERRGLSRKTHPQPGKRHPNDAPSSEF